MPNETIYLTLKSREELFEAISALRVRGAPAIGIFAAYAVFVLSCRTKAASFDEFYAEFSENAAYLDSSRPTAVNLRKALDRMDGVVKKCSGLPIPRILEAMKAEALAIHREDMDMCLRISEYGLGLVKDGDGILTYCNAGPLASPAAPGLERCFWPERGITLHVYCCETRPLLQGLATT